MIARQGFGVAVANAIAARIPYVRHHHPVEAQGAGDSVGLPWRSGPIPLAIPASNTFVLAPDQARQQRGVRSPLRVRRNPANRVLHRGNGKPLRLYPGHPPRRPAQTAIRGRPTARTSRECVPEIVLVVSRTIPRSTLGRNRVPACFTLRASGVSTSVVARWLLLDRIK